MTSDANGTTTTVTSIMKESITNGLPLSDANLKGLPAIGALAILSVLSTATLAIFISYRLIMWRRYYQSFIGRNQYVLLVFNLTVADFIQGLGFVICFYWNSKANIESNSNWCFAQGFLIHLGDVSSCLFVFAIALHTWLQLMVHKPIKTNHVIWASLGLWAVGIFLSVITPILRGRQCMAPSGAWCWISGIYEHERLWTHYIWIFASEFTCFILYMHCWLFLYRHSRRFNNMRLQSPAQSYANRKLARSITTASYIMLLYPLVYTMFTLPIAASRMALMANHNVPDAYWVIGGCFLTSCGWADALIYALTRRALLRGEMGEASGDSDANGHDRGSKSLPRIQVGSERRPGSETDALVVSVAEKGAGTRISISKGQDSRPTSDWILVTDHRDALGQQAPHRAFEACDSIACYLPTMSNAQHKERAPNKSTVAPGETYDNGVSKILKEITKTILPKADPPFDAVENKEHNFDEHKQAAVRVTHEVSTQTSRRSESSFAPNADAGVLTRVYHESLSP